LKFCQTQSLKKGDSRYILALVSAAKDQETLDFYLSLPH